MLAIEKRGELFHVLTSNGVCTAKGVSGNEPYGDPSGRVLRSGFRIDPSDPLGRISQPAALPAGAVMVVGSGQSGAQIAEDLHLAGRKVHLVTGNAPRCARFYRGRDVVDWLWDIGQYEITVADDGMGHKRHDTNHYLTGRDGGRDIDFRAFAKQGMSLYGRLKEVANGRMMFEPNLKPISTRPTGSITASTR